MILINNTSNNKIYLNLIKTVTVNEKIKFNKCKIMTVESFFYTLFTIKKNLNNLMTCLI
jgi:hypothetical protein